MRDIHGDLKERADLLRQQLNNAQAQFERLLEQLKKDRESQLEALKFQLEAVNKVLEMEHRRRGSAASAPRAQLLQQPEPQQPPAITEISKLRRAI
jgi:hypothetical protein